MGTSKTLGVLVDTNILLYVYDRIDPFWLVVENLDYKPKFFIHEVVIKELEALENKFSRSFSLKARIRLAKEYLDKYKNMWELIPSNNEIGSPDEILLDTAEKKGLILFTNDRQLKIKAIKKGLGIIFLTSEGKIIKSNFPI